MKITNLIKSLFEKKASPSYPQLPVVKDNGESNIPGIYIVGDVAGNPLVKICLNDGYKLGNTLAEKLKRTENTGGYDYDVVVLGGGVAGVAVAARLKEKEYNALVIESENIRTDLK